MNGSHGGPLLDFLSRLAASSALGVALGAAAIVLSLLWRRDGRTLVTVAAVLLAVGATDLFVGKGLKPTIARPRPCHVWTDTVQLRETTCGGLFGFPSNHAANNAAVVGALWGRAPKGVVAFFVAFTAFVGWSRVYVGAHYPGDVLGGILVGLLFGWACRKLVLRLADAVAATRLRL